MTCFNTKILPVLPEVTFFAALMCIPVSVFSQRIDSFEFNPSQGLTVKGITTADTEIINLKNSVPLYTFEVNGKQISSRSAGTTEENGAIKQLYPGNLETVFKVLKPVADCWHGELTFRNNGSDTVLIGNVVPFGTDRGSVYITSKGPWNLAKAYLFRPGFSGVRVILPDNAWELGYCSFEAGNYSVCALARRIITEGGTKRRYETVLPPGSTVVYNIFASLFSGEWQNGLRFFFRDRFLFDLEKFDDTLYRRDDLSWIKKSYLIILQMAWDNGFYDRLSNKYRFSSEIIEWSGLFGHVDVFGIWPTWPRLGLDSRNQWDMYRTLPGGTEQLKAFSKMAKLSGTRFFIAYNPWDNSTRPENHLKGMAQIIKDTEADGVVLDTRGSSTAEIQAAADSVRKGVIMFSEGMAVPRDMPGIIAGRVHNAIYFSPELNLNKLIKPDFSIFRVCDIGEDRNYREILIAFFNGYGTELNLFRPGGRNDQYREDLKLLAKTIFILRQNNDAFLDFNWTPLIRTLADKIYVNRWQANGKTIFTVLNMRQEGFYDELFELDSIDNTHIVSLWNHTEVSPVSKNGKYFVKVACPGWSSSVTGTRGEGSADCIAVFSAVINSELKGDSLHISVPDRGKTVLWIGNPSYENKRSFTLKFNSDTVISIASLAGNYEGKIVLQFFQEEILRDERVIYVEHGKPWLVSRVLKTEPAKNLPEGMVLVPGARIEYSLTTDDEFIPYPNVNKTFSVEVDSFLIDKYPVTNLQYYDFLVSSGYVPRDTTNFLRHWENGKYRLGQENYPVVYLSYEDMQAYAEWAGKRLPTEAEWQLAAQGTDRRKWPWGNEFRGTWCNNSFGRPTPVDAFPKGASPYGVCDLTGNVWQMTGDMYFNGNYYFTIIRGGSFFNPESSWWYIKGGPQPLDKTQIMLMVSPGFDRSETVGFRCVKDIEPGSFRAKSK